MKSQAFNYEFNDFAVPNFMLVLIYLSKMLTFKTKFLVQYI